MVGKGCSSVLKKYIFVWKKKDAIINKGEINIFVNEKKINLD